jgi:hypothetical protein
MLYSIYAHAFMYVVLTLSICEFAVYRTLIRSYMNYTAVYHPHDSAVAAVLCRSYLFHMKLILTALCSCKMRMSGH